MKILNQFALLFAAGMFVSCARLNTKLPDGVVNGSVPDGTKSIDGGTPSQSEGDTTSADGSGSKTTTGAVTSSHLIKLSSEYLHLGSCKAISLKSDDFSGLPVQDPDVITYLKFSQEREASVATACSDQYVLNTTSAVTVSSLRKSFEDECKAEGDSYSGAVECAPQTSGFQALTESNKEVPSEVVDGQTPAEKITNKIRLTMSYSGITEDERLVIKKGVPKFFEFMNALIAGFTGEPIPPAEVKFTADFN